MKTKYFTRFALTCAAVFALGAASMTTSCGDDTTGGTPVITIKTHPTAPAALTEGEIPADTKLTVEATVTGGATLSYQWYSNTVASNEGGTTIDGATAASYTLPTTLTAGTYHYFCELSAEGAESRRTYAATVTVIGEPVPTITITTPPTTPAGLTEGEIPADTKLTIEANVTMGATLSYQWYTNTTASNEGGTAISGATTASYTLPTTLTAGTYYYFCELSAEGAATVRSNVVAVTVNVVPLVAQNSRITWKDGKYVLTTDPTDGGLYFKFGSVVGLFSGNDEVLPLPPPSDYDYDFPTGFNAADIAWNPTEIIVWKEIPAYKDTDYPARVDAAYHTAANVKTGKGDPCRLVGLDLAKIKSTAAGSLTPADIDNGLWRMPTDEDNLSFVGQTGGVAHTTHWTMLSGVNGGMFPDVTDGSADTFLPAAGFRGSFNGSPGGGVNVQGLYWSNTPNNSTEGYGLYFYEKGIYPYNSEQFAAGYPVRCVRQ